MQPRFHPLRATPVQCQPVGRNQQHLEEHKQVEQIARQESAVDPHQLELKQGVEIGAPAVIPAAGIEQGREGQHRSQHQHQRAELIQHQHNPERRLPVTQRIDGDFPTPGLIAQKNGCRQHRRTGQQAGDPPQPVALTDLQQQQHARQGRNQNRRNNPVIHERPPSSGLPST